MQVIAPGITRVATSKNDNSYLVEGADGLTVVDAGRAGAADALLHAAAMLGMGVVRIVLTHAHPDHVQGSTVLRRRTSARVYIHNADAAWLSQGRVPADGRSGAMARRYDGLAAGQWTPVDADDVLAGGDVVGGLRVIHTHPDTRRGTSPCCTSPAGPCSSGTQCSAPAGWGSGRRASPPTRTRERPPWRGFPATSAPSASATANP